MFDKDQPTISGPGTVVGASVKLTGVLKDANDIIVHGNVDGEIISGKNVNISETASVKGPVTAEVVTISGKVNGAITAYQKLEINSTGKVYGSINTEDLVIQSGAIFVGKSNTLKEEKEKKAVSEKKETKEEKAKESGIGQIKEEKTEGSKEEIKYEVE